MKADAYNKYIGQVFDRRYKIVKTIGIGGMAVVFEAYDITTGKRVAIKMLKDTIENDTQAIRRFINESRAISMMDSDNIVKIYYVSVSGPHKFIAMEYIDGITLREYMNHKGMVSWSETVEFAIQILTALGHAHSKGIIHRDIKPQNIMLTEGGYVKVTDFGIAKIPKAETLTMIDKAIGTVYYISPEQARGLKIDARSDLYSLGIMMYEMVTGRLPFVGEAAISVLVSHMNEMPKPPTMYKTAESAQEKPDGNIPSAPPDNENTHLGNRHRQDQGTREASLRQFDGRDAKGTDVRRYTHRQYSSLSAQ